ncbi:MAG: 50S ribosome-binding GTPase [Selenomonadaceae bacterium]|nr:50S ribosome-binding GTPase [Selenomonadaceae bacterium]
MKKKALNTKYGDIFVDWFNKHSDDAPEAFSASLDDFTSKLFEKAETTQADGEKVYIVNAGRMNHGKSSLFNSLLGKNELAVEDVRCTVENREVPWKDNFILMDTPGLDATDDDNTVAYEGYKKANMILFVHTVKVGELHESEIKAINKMKEIIGKEYFGKHFCLVLSFRDSVSPEALENIKNASVSTIKTACDTGAFPVFCISNRRYQKGMQENKMGLVALSGIPELIDYIEDKSEEWQSDKVGLQEKQNEEMMQQIIPAMEDCASELKNSKGNDKNVDIKGVREYIADWKNRYGLLGQESDDLQKKIDARNKENEEINEKIMKNTNESLVHYTGGFLGFVGRFLARSEGELERENEALEERIRQIDAEIWSLDKRHLNIFDEQGELWDEIKLKMVKVGIWPDDKDVEMSELYRKLDEVEAEQEFAVTKKEAKVGCLLKAAKSLKEITKAANTKPGINRQMVILTQYADSFDIDIDELKEAVQRQADDEAKDILQKLRERMENINDECHSAWQKLLSSAEAAVEERYNAVSVHMKEVHAISNEWNEAWDRVMAIGQQITALWKNKANREKFEETERKAKALEAKQDEIKKKIIQPIEHRRNAKCKEAGRILHELGIWGEQAVFVDADEALNKNIESYQERLMEKVGLGSVYMKYQNSKKVLRAIDNMLAQY